MKNLFLLRGNYLILLKAMTNGIVLVDFSNVVFIFGLYARTHQINQVVAFISFQNVKVFKNTTTKTRKMGLK